MDFNHNRLYVLHTDTLSNMSVQEFWYIISEAKIDNKTVKPKAMTRHRQQAKAISQLKCSFRVEERQREYAGKRCSELCYARVLY